MVSQKGNVIKSVDTIIEAFPSEKIFRSYDGSSFLDIAECFANTIQGENLSGYPSVFLRLQHCTLNCIWCDTTEVWRKGNRYTNKELLKLWREKGVINLLNKGHHLVLTGGSPLRQQDALIELLSNLQYECENKPYIEIENECTRMPTEEFVKYINRWNNSPKLSNSGMSLNLRYKPKIIEYLAKLKESYFKFVISKGYDWDEIEKYYLNTDLIRKDQIVLMPEGSSREELQKNYQTVVNICCENGVRMCDRFHVTIWDKVIGV
jgi:organic radical activating enzyme